MMGLVPRLAASGHIYISSSEKSGVSCFPVSSRLDPKPPPVCFVFLRAGSETSEVKKPCEL